MHSAPARAAVAAAELFDPEKCRRLRHHRTSATQWRRMQASDTPAAQSLSDLAARIGGINSIYLPRQMNAVRVALDLAEAEAETRPSPPTARNIPRIARQNLNSASAPRSRGV